MEHLLIVLNGLSDNKMVANLNKCTFATHSIEYLGHVISADGVAADPTKIKAMKQWPIPTTVKQLRGFLGLTGYYRKFVAGYGTIAYPLTQLLKKDNFGWNDAAQVAFDTLIQAMMEVLVLALPDFKQPFVVETDASGVRIRAVLMQNGRPLAFFSRALPHTHRLKAVYERELIAIVLAV